MSNYILTKSLGLLPSSQIILGTDLDKFSEFAELDLTNAEVVAAAGLTVLPAPSNTKSETEIFLIADKNSEGNLISKFITVDEYKAIQNTKMVTQAVLDLRNKLLQDSDWTQLKDVTTSANWATYRQALRDITAQPGYPLNVTWPAKPE